MVALLPNTTEHASTYNLQQAPLDADLFVYITMAPLL
jgi:hypothetical protein